MNDLHWLAESGQLDELREALAGGTAPDPRDEEGRTPLLVAAIRGDVEAIGILAGAGADLDTAETLTPGWRPLHRASLPSSLRERGDLPAILRLLELGADARAANALGVTTLHLVVSWCDADLVHRLLDAGADPGAVDTHGVTPLHVACSRGASTWSEALLADDGELAVPALGRRAETAVARLEDGPVLEALIEGGADPNVKDRQGLTPLHVAAEHGTEWAARRLLADRADPAPTDTYEVTPLHRVSDPEIARLLLEAGAEVDAPDRDGSTPLHRAIGTGRSAVAELLLDRGAGVNARDREGRTPLHLAAGAGSGLLVDRLLDTGADLGAKDLSGRTPRDDALTAGHSQVAGRLKQRGGGWRFPFFGR